ncbi:amino acid transporter [Thozetella sp. PMI_491]|nr:amino acid transporter [Thozetella sp. PMI_491]
MVRSLALLFLAACGTSLAAPQGYKRATCETKTARKPWGTLTSDEKSAYIDAELCLMAAPSKSGIDGAQTRWDDLQWNHIVQANFIHDVGAFLPWHRYYVVVHGNLLRDECGYTGPLPYWDETADASLSSLDDAEIFQADAFGGDGAGDEGYIQDGPFASTTLHLKRLGYENEDYHIYRDLYVANLTGALQSSLDACFELTTYEEAWPCWHWSPHNGGHSSVGGLMFDVVLSPGDPTFFLHHGWLDAMWWKWQSLDLPARLTDMGGQNLPDQWYIDYAELPMPGPEFTDYDGDEGNVTTLAHVLYASGLYPNVTIADVMDPAGDVVCAEYFYSDSFTVPSAKR